MARIRESRRERTLPTPNSLSTDSTTDFKTALTAGLLVMASLWAMVRFVIVLEEEREEEIEEKGEEGEREKGGRDRGRGRGRGWGRPRPDWWQQPAKEAFHVCRGIVQRRGTKTQTGKDSGERPGRSHVLQLLFAKPHIKTLSWSWSAQNDCIPPHTPSASPCLHLIWLQR